MRDTVQTTKLFSTATAIFTAVLIATLAACGGGGNGYGGGGNMAATSVTLNSPGSVVNRTVTLTASPTVATGVTVTRIDFFVDGTMIGTATASPFTAKWDTSTIMDGSHTLTVKITDSKGATVTSPSVMVTVTNSPSLTVSLSAAQVYPVPTSTASGSATLTFNLVSGASSGKVMLTGVTATAVSIGEGFAGSKGMTLITLTKNAANAMEWDIPAAALLTADQVTALLQGKLYISVLSAANPNGELRGQIVPSNITVVWTTLSGGEEVPPVTITASGVAATTVDSLAKTVSIHVNSTGVNDASAAEIDTGAKGAVGTKLVALTKDAVNMGHWSTELAAITSTDLTNFTGSMWYVNVITPAQMNGAIRGQISTTATPAAPTLTQLQTTVFSHCTGCHNGNGTALPGSMDLTAGHVYASLVNVASVEKSTLKRVAPNDPANSYVIQKLQGDAGIGGSRMPLGGPYFDQPTIDTVKAWISAGAQNN